MPIGSIIGGIIGSRKQGDAEKRARDIQSQILGNLAKIKAPTMEDLRIQLTMLKSAGQITPEEEAEILSAPSEFLTLAEDQQMRNELLSAAERLRSAESGLSAEDRAVLNEIRSQTAQQNRAAQESILQNMASRGIAGSGNELAARLSAQQAASQQASEQGDRLAAMAQQRGMQALKDRVGLMQNLKTGAEQLAQNRAAGIDAVNKWRTDLKQGLAGRNVALRNQAQIANLANKQRIMDANVDLANEQERYNKSLPQTIFQNELAKAGMINQQMGNMSNLAMQSANRTAALYAGIGSALDTGGSDFAKSKGDTSGAGAAGALAPILMALSDKEKKTQIKDGRQSLEEFLDSISKNMNKYASGGLVKSSSGLMMDQDALDLAKYIEDGEFRKLQATNNRQDLTQDLSQDNSKPSLMNKSVGDTSFEPGETSIFDEKATPRIRTDNLLSTLGLGRLPQVKNVNVVSRTPFSENNFARGGVVEGPEIVSGDQEINDVVPAALSVGEIVIPKSAVKQGKAGIDEFLSKILPKEYEYKNPEIDGEGKFVSPMAQDLEKTELGKSMVIDTPRGKMIDYAKGFGTMLASQALLKEKIDEIEKRLGVRK